MNAGDFDNSDFDTGNFDTEERFRHRIFEESEFCHIFGHFDIFSWNVIFVFLSGFSFRGVCFGGFYHSTSPSNLHKFSLIMIIIAKNALI